MAWLLVSQSAQSCTTAALHTTRGLCRGSFTCRYDFGVFTNCEGDVDVYCKEAKSKLRGNATVLKCLVENFKSLQDSCQIEMSRAVRIALWDYKPGAALTAACDVDVETVCPRVSAIWTPHVCSYILCKQMLRPIQAHDSGRWIWCMCR